MLCFILLVGEVSDRFACTCILDEAARSAVCAQGQCRHFMIGFLSPEVHGPGHQNLHLTTPRNLDTENPWRGHE